jgi:DNA-binding response OmpR family regulator
MIMKRILVIEDGPLILGLVKEILENEGYLVSTMCEASHYKPELNRIHPDLVLLDLNIAGFDGEIICEYIKGHSGLKDIPIILMSANPNIQQVREHCGAEDYIKKPFSLNSFIDKVHAYA